MARRGAGNAAGASDSRLEVDGGVWEKVELGILGEVWEWKQLLGCCGSVGVRGEARGDGVGVVVLWWSIWLDKWP